MAARWRTVQWLIQKEGAASAGRSYAASGVYAIGSPIRNSVADLRDSSKPGAPVLETRVRTGQVANPRVIPDSAWRAA